uniref:Uncharacterized protein LOC114343956 n=1 Tax=Diabrotica virgifera virgifera TaxID=50390 RepID=A0A6P7GX03_DIAVI
MPQCYVSTCSNYYGKTRGNTKIIYHMLPTAPEMISQWIKVCRTDFEPPPLHARVCSEHFSENCYQRDLQHELLGLPLRKKLKYDAIPDLNLPVKHVKAKKQILKEYQNQTQQREVTVIKKVGKTKVGVKKIPHRNSLDSNGKDKPVKKIVKSKSLQNLATKTVDTINLINVGNKSIEKSINMSENKNILKKLQQLSAFGDIDIKVVDRTDNKDNNCNIGSDTASEAAIIKNKVKRRKSNEKMEIKVNNAPDAKSVIKSVKRSLSSNDVKVNKDIFTKPKILQRNTAKKKQSLNNGDQKKVTTISSITFDEKNDQCSKSHATIFKISTQDSANGHKNVNKEQQEVTNKQFKQISSGDKIHVNAVSEMEVANHGQSSTSHNENLSHKKHRTQIPKLKMIPTLDSSFNKLKRRPMRSSIRIAKKKSIESLSDSFTEKVNNKRDYNKRERFTDKLKFMAKLQLKHEKNKFAVIDLDHFFGEMMTNGDEDVSDSSVVRTPTLTIILATVALG